MYKIKISIDAPILPAGSGVTHVSTSWQLSRFPDFEKREYLVYESLEDTTNMLVNYYQTEDLDTPIYARVKYYFDNGLSSEWSKIIPVRGDQIGLKLSSTVILTPTVEARIIGDYTNREIVIKSTPMVLYSGVGIHSSTTWEIVNEYGKVVYSRKKDVDNLLTLTIPGNIITLDEIYFARVMYHTDTNTDSKFGTTMLLGDIENSNIFGLELKSLPIVNNDIYFSLVLYSTSFNSIDMIIKDSSGITVATNLNQTSVTPFISSNGLTLIEEYCIYARLNFGDNLSSSYSKIWCGKFLDNAVLPKDINTKYLNKYSFTQELLLKGYTTQSSIELYNGNILYTKHHDNNIYYYSRYGDMILEKGIAGKLDGYADAMDMQYVNMLPLDNGNVLVDYYAVYSVHSGSPLYTDIINNGAGTPDITLIEDGENIITYRAKFALFDFNQATNQLTLISSKFRNDELYSTSVNNSMAVINDEMYYIPAEYDDGKDLNIRKVNLNTLEVTDIVDLPISGIKTNANLVYSNDNTLLFFGGSTAYYLDNDVGEIYLADRINDDMYEFNIATNNFNKINNELSKLPTSIYSVQAYLMRNYDICLFNSSRTGLSVGNQDTYIYNNVTKQIDIKTNDMSDHMVYRNTIRFRNGDIVRISSRTTDPQLAYIYPTERIIPIDIVENTTVDIITNLVVAANDEITITNPYLYETIDINGTSDTDTGKLFWQDGNAVEVFTYKDLLVPHDRTLTEEEASKYDNIIVLGGATLNIV